MINLGNHNSFDGNDYDDNDNDMVMKIIVISVVIDERCSENAVKKRKTYLKTNSNILSCQPRL